eukprot:815755-Rhodomonas_salina.1
MWKSPAKLAWLNELSAYYMELGAKLHLKVLQLQDTVKAPASTPKPVTAEKSIGVFPLRIDAAHNPDTEPPIKDGNITLTHSPWKEVFGLA